MKVVLLASGRGSNVNAVLEAWKRGDLGRAQPVAVLSDREDAPVLDIAKGFGVHAEFVHPGPKKTWMPPPHEQRWVDRVSEFEPNLVVLAGFMRVLHDTFLQAFDGRMINLHPSLLPSFKGLHAIKQAFDYGVKFTGCTVHYVTPEVDGGRIIDQQTVRIETGETLEAVERKVHAAEHALLPDVIRRLAEAC